MAYTTIDDPSAHFQTATYTGTGSTQSITNDGNSDLQPDWLWIKARSTGTSHLLNDSSRGVTEYLFSNLTNAETTSSVDVTSFNSDGFSLSTGASVNGSGQTFAAWQWKANGGTTSSNTDGTLTSTVQANTDAGFSIVTYSNPATGNKTVGHGLGVQPEVIIFKNTVDVVDWHVASKYLTNYRTYGMQLNSDNSQAIYSNAMNSTEPTSSVFSIGGISRTGDNGNEVVAYCFASKQGYSKIGKYVGNGSTTNGAFVYTGFKPAFVMIKAINATKNWVMLDNKRLGYNGGMYYLYANTSGAEGETPSSGGHIDLLSNGFKIYDNWTLTNQNGVDYLYMAFAENPFVTSTGIPTTAR